MRFFWTFLKNTGIFLCNLRQINFIVLCIFVTGLSVWAGFGWIQEKKEVPQNWSKAIDFESELAKIHPKDHLSLRRGSTLAGTLLDANVNRVEAHEVATAAADTIDVRSMRPGKAVVLTWEDEFHTRLMEVAVTLDRRKTLQIKKTDGFNWKAEIEEVQTTTEELEFYGEVQASLWESGIQAGLEPTLVVELAEIFGWQIDFNREIRSGDRWRLVTEVEKKPDGEILNFGPIVAAEYVNRGDVFSAVRYTTANNDTSYYDLDGQSLKRMFLKSPIRFARITSRFQRGRFHPILKKVVPHNGVDYGAPTGTPIRSVGDGRVEKIVQTRAGGKSIHIRHNSTYKTAYLHMSRYAKGMRRGRRIRQGEVIGYVGSTGYATAPHLHFAFYENGKFTDPLGRKFPSKDPVPKKELAEYKKAAAELYAKLPKYPPPVEASVVAERP